MLVFLTLVGSLLADSLQSLITEALASNTAVKQIALDASLAQQKRDANSADRFGEVDIVGSYNHYNTARTLIPLTPATILVDPLNVTTTKDLVSVGASYQVALFTGFAQTRQVEIDDIAHSMSKAKTKLTKEQIAYNVRSLYLSALALEELLEAQQRYTQAMQTLQDKIALEVELGKKATIDLLKAKADVENSKSSEIRLHSQIGITLATLSELVGREVTTLEPIDIEVTPPQEETTTLIAHNEELTKIAVENMSISKAQKAVEKTNALYMPTLAFASYWGKNYGEDERTSNWENETLWQVGVNAKWNIFNFGKTSALKEQATIAKLKANLHKEQTLLSLKKQIKEALYEINLNYAQYNAQQTQLALAKESARIEEVRYNNNASTINDLLLAKAKIKLAEAKMIQNKYNYKKSKYYLDYLLERGVQE
jgi:outer membrane protein TolC